MQRKQLTQPHNWATNTETEVKEAVVRMQDASRLRGAIVQVHTNPQLPTSL